MVILVMIVLAASAHAVGTTNYVPGEILVKFRPGCVMGRGDSLTSMDFSAELNKQLGSTLKEDFSSHGLSGVQLVKISEDMTVEEAIKEYQKNPCVEYAEPNFIGEYTETIPTDTSFALQWALDNTGQTGGTVDADIDAPEAWDLVTGSTSVLIALPDSGTEITHSDLSTNIWTNPGEIAGNGIDDDGNGYIDDVHGWDFEGNDADVSSTNTHGTHCAGIIGAIGNNNLGVSGAMWTTRIIPLKIGTGVPTTANAVLAILYANNKGAQIISCSWNVGDSQTLKDAITASTALVVVAAGNNGVDLDPSCTVYPACYNYNQILVVTGTDHTDAQVYNYGLTSTDVGAPGVGIYSTVIGNGYGYLSGTSMATPLTAGVAGVIRARDPSLTNTELKAVIMNTVDTLPSLATKCASGGRINLFNALLSTDDTDPVTTIIVSGPMTCSPWYKGPVVVSFTASDDFSLVATTEYALNGGAWTAYTAPFTVSAQGTTTISYRSTDQAGNTEIAKTRTVQIDSIPPMISGAPTTAANANGWYKTNVIVHFTASDSGSGLKSVSPDTTLTTEGMNQQVIGTAEDNACNSASFTVSGINIDKTLPIVVITSPVNSHVYAVNEPVVADWSVSDTLSGIASTSSTLPDGANVPTDTGGTYTFNVQGTDFAENTQSITSTYSVHYIFSGISPSLEKRSVYKLNSAIAVKFQLLDYTGANIEDAVATLYVKGIDPVSSEIPATSVNGLTAFRYDQNKEQYLFNLNTKPLAAGDWEMRILLDDGASYIVPFTLR